MPPLIDLTNKRFGKLVVVKKTGHDKHRNVKWLCQCDCSKFSEVVGRDLHCGDTKSCGCLRKDIVRKTGKKNTQHGHCSKNKSSITYESWHAMLQRCINPKNHSYHDYGGSGIKVCDRWLVFQSFLEDMGDRPSTLHTIDRIKNNYGYKKENCRWATYRQQQRNKKNNRKETYKGITRLVIEWAEKYKIPYGRLWKRLYVSGWSIERSLTESVQKPKRRKK